MILRVLRICLILSFLNGIQSALQAQQPEQRGFRSKRPSANRSSKPDLSLRDQYDIGRTAWKIRPASDTMNGAHISLPGYLTSGWVNGIVPGTVFSAYVADGLEQDPNFADNIYKVDTAKYNRSFWYRTEFTIPESYNNKTVWLNFDGINKRGEIYLNGHLVKDGVLQGMMQRGRFNITGLLKRTGNNILAVKVSPPAYYKGHELANYESPTYICSQGWDWMPPVPGFNSGITDKVYLSCTGAVRIMDPWVRAELPSNSLAHLSVNLVLKDTSGTPVTGKVKVMINPGHISFTSGTITLSDTLPHAFNYNKDSFPQLTIHNPQLWWPNGYGGKADGTQYLYSCKVSFEVDNNSSDAVTRQFGIRRFSYDTIGGPLHIYVNSVPVYIKGGNWGMSEYLLRARDTSYETRIRFHKEMNFNMIRNWTGEVTDEAFYDACDKYGILVWDDFWLNGPGWITDKDTAIFRNNVEEKVKRFRDHPSIAVWCGANEGIPGFSLTSNVSVILSNAIHKFDKNEQNDSTQRIYLPRSNAGPANAYTTGNSHNLSGSGIWDNKPPAQYFTDPSNGYPWSKGSWGFRTELGTATFPNIESFKRFIPPDKLWPRNEVWDKHFFDDNNGAHPAQYISDINSRYGTPASLEAFCKKAQLINLATTKAMFEGWQDHMGSDASGLLMWMSQPAYPSMIWQTYDYYYDLTGAYFGAKQACEPVHIQWNSADDSIKVINNKPYPLKNVVATAAVYNENGSENTELSESATISVPANSVKAVFKIRFVDAKPSALSPVHFLKLVLRDAKGPVSDNFYWRGRDLLNFKDLDSMPRMTANMLQQSKPVTKSLPSGHQLVTYTLTNPLNAPGVAFGIRVKMMNATGELVLPIILNDNYFSLLKGETKVITIEYDPGLLRGGGYTLSATPYNN